MKAESNIMPQHPFVVDKRGELADITFFADPQFIETDGEVIWAYNTYSLSIPYRNDIETIITENLQAWLDAAIKTEQMSKAPDEPTDKERIQAIEAAMLFLIDGGSL